MPQRNSQTQQSKGMKKIPSQFLKQHMEKQKKQMECLKNRSLEKLFDRLPFQRLVKDIAHKSSFDTKDLRWQSATILALQEACELWLISIFEDVQCLCNHAGRETIFKTDLRLTLKLRGCDNMVRKLAEEERSRLLSEGKQMTLDGWVTKQQK